VDLFRSVNLRANLQPVVITNGHEIGGGDGGAYLVPKTELVSTVQLLLQGRRLRIAPTLKEAKTLARELQTFKTQKVNLSATETFEAWRERDHDDLVLAVALAAWMAEPPPGHHFTRVRNPTPAAHEPMPPVHALDWAEERRQEWMRRESEPKRRRLFGR
jgi:hypothetical protein